jgi:hypothetical protein
MSPANIAIAALAADAFDYRAFKAALADAAVNADSWQALRWAVRRVLPADAGRKEAKVKAWSAVARRMAGLDGPLHVFDAPIANYISGCAGNSLVSLRFKRDGNLCRISYRIDNGEWLQFGDALPGSNPFNIHDVFHFALRQEAGWSVVLEHFLNGADINKVRMAVLREEAMVIAWNDGIADVDWLIKMCPANVDAASMSNAMNLGDFWFKACNADYQSSDLALAQFSA